MEPSKSEASEKPDSIVVEDKVCVSPAVDNQDKPCSPLPKHLCGTSRYGRVIKPKSPSTLMLDSPKNLKMPKIIKQQVTVENKNSRIEDSLNSTNDSMSESFNTTIETTVNIEDIQAKSPWALGQVVWARYSSFPYWPGIITLNPTSMSYVSQRGSNPNYRLVHVRYCADRGRRNWVPFANILPFCGLEDFEEQSKKVYQDKKKAAGFIVKLSLKSKWDEAVIEASDLMTKSIEERIELFKPNTKKESPSHSPERTERPEENKRKRKQSTLDGAVYKKSKLDVSREVEAEESKELNGDLETNTGNHLDLETPPTPPLSNKDSSDEAPIMRKRHKKRTSCRDGVFEVFCERNREQAEQLDPDASEADIQEYMLSLWHDMSSVERSKYRADYLQNEGLYSMDVDEDENENVDEDEDEEEDDEDEYEDDDEDEDEEEDSDDVESEPETEKLSKKRKNRVGAEVDEFTGQEGTGKKAKKWTIKSLLKAKDASDLDETASVDSETIGKSARKRKTKTRRESSDDTVESETNEKSSKKTKAQKEYSMILDSISKTKQHKLFKGMKNERVCQICLKPGKLIRCKGPCHSHFHLACVKPSESGSEPSDTEDNSAYAEDLREIKEKSKKNNQKEDESSNAEDENFKCIDCLSGVAPPCFVCHKREGERSKCSGMACGKHYHSECLKGWPQCQWHGDRLICPYHICHTCASDNPQNSHARSNNGNFVRCVKCPSTYHASISCLPAGSHILTGSQIECPKHYKSAYPPVNTTWCFLCTEGGSLICCDTCPMSFHVECVGLENAPDGNFICEDCETGRLPLYGEVVWVKHSNYRWWPSVICYPQDIPQKVLSQPHKTGEFCVMFLGSRNYCWIHRGKAFLYQEGDSCTKGAGSTKKVEEAYRRALEEAKIVHDNLMSRRAIAKDRDNNSKDLKPPPYVKIKVNKPVGNVKIPEVDSLEVCVCDPTQPNPCSADSSCLNRVLMIECSPDVCPAGTKCQNQLFVQRRYPAMKPAHTEERGWGLKTLESIKQGQFIIEYVGEIIDEAEYKLRIQLKKERKNENYYFLTIDTSRMIDAEPKGNFSRFMNHSCQPNCETQKWTVNGDTRIGLFALRDIEVGEELTFNYNLACDGETRKPCLCKAPNCSGFIGAKVPKQQISLMQQKKIEKAEKVKKQKRHQKKIIKCWNCSLQIDNLEEAIKCDQKTCGKYYHPHCIAIEDGPDKIFHCPWHFCAECYKRTSMHCSYCCNAFCQIHIYGNLHEHPETKAFVCFNHPTEYASCGDLESSEALLEHYGKILGEATVNDYNATNGTHNQITQEGIDTSSLALDPAIETSPRGTIVEVETSSEDDDVRPNPISSSSPKKSQKNVITPAENNFTLDQIAAIIGIG